MEINKNGIVYKHMQKHRISFAVIVALVVMLFAYTVIGSAPYISSYINGAVPLDTERYKTECKTENYPEPFEFHRGEDKSIPNYAVKGTSYWQDDKFEFEITLSDVKNTGITYTSKTTGSASSDEVESAVIYSADIGGIQTFIITYPDTDYKDGDKISGIFNTIPQIVKYNLAEYSNSIKQSDKISSYIFDTRGIEMESAGFDMISCIILFVFVLLLSGKLVIQFINPLHTPTYRQFEKYGDPLVIADSVDSEVEMSGKKISKKELITQSWIVSEDVFKLKVVKNHLKFGNIKYVSDKN